MKILISHENLGRAGNIREKFIWKTGLSEEIIIIPCKKGLKFADCVLSLSSEIRERDEKEEIFLFFDGSSINNVSDEEKKETLVQLINGLSQVILISEEGNKEQLQEALNTWSEAKSETTGKPLVICEEWKLIDIEILSEQQPVSSNPEVLD